MSLDAQMHRSPFQHREMPACTHTFIIRRFIEGLHLSRTTVQIPAQMHISAECTVICFVFHSQSACPWAVFVVFPVRRFSVFECLHIRHIKQIRPHARRPASSIAEHPVHLHIRHRIALEMLRAVVRFRWIRAVLRSYPVFNQGAHRHTRPGAPKPPTSKGRFRHRRWKITAFIEIILYRQRRQHRVQSLVRTISRPIAHMAKGQIAAHTPMSV